MKLTEAKAHFIHLLENELNKFIETRGTEFITPSPLCSPEDQIKILRHHMLSILKREKYYDDFKEALILIREHLPRILSHDEYETVEKEFIQAREIFESNLDSIVNLDKEAVKEITIGHMLGFSENTHKQLIALINDFYNNQYYEDAMKVSLFLFVIASRCIEGGLALGRCLDRLERYEEAINVYESMQKIFPNDPTSKLLCAKACLGYGDRFKASMYLEEGLKLLEDTPQMMQEWSPLVQQIQKQL